MDVLMDTQENCLTFDYTFFFENGSHQNFSIRLDAHELSYVAIGKSSRRPYWAELEYCQCANCPLLRVQQKYCPIALNLVDFFDHFNTLYSYNIAKVIISTEERTYLKKTSIQQSLGSMLGIIMVSSGCPIMNRLKPMVRFHLPFASIEETVFRSVSVYLVGQYFARKQGKTADLDLSGLKEFYLEVQEVNVGMAHRLRSVTKTDAFANAIITLDAFAKELPCSIEEQLKDMEYLFHANNAPLSGPQKAVSAMM
ncbi:hypothetical protein JW960_15490 [candidate division KSB1 bacterium]|nr:hypothetical protein [candidate division KSB1 bacterium]